MTIWSTYDLFKCYTTNSFNSHFEVLWTNKQFQVSKNGVEIIKLENIIEFTKNNLFPEETNKDFIKLCKKIIKKDNKLKYFLEEIKFIKDKGKKSCNYFFSFLEYIYTIFFPGFNFFQESYSISLK